MADTKLTEKISLNGEIGDTIFEALQHDKYKSKIRAMIKDHTQTVEFEELVMKYAGKEYENRLLKSGRFWATTVISAVITAVIASTVSILITANQNNSKAEKQNEQTTIQKTN